MGNVIACVGSSLSSQTAAPVAETMDLISTTAAEKVLLRGQEPAAMSLNQE